MVSRFKYNVVLKGTLSRDHFLQVLVNGSEYDRIESSFYLQLEVFITAQGRNFELAVNHSDLLFSKEEFSLSMIQSSNLKDLGSIRIPREKIEIVNNSDKSFTSMESILMDSLVNEYKYLLSQTLSNPTDFTPFDFSGNLFQLLLSKNKESFFEPFELTAEIYYL